MWKAIGVVAPCHHSPGFLSLGSGYSYTWISFLRSAHSFRMASLIPDLSPPSKQKEEKGTNGKRQRDIWIFFFHYIRKTKLSWKPYLMIFCWHSIAKMIREISQVQEESGEENSFSWAHCHPEQNWLCQRKGGNEYWLGNLVVSATDVNVYVCNF